MREGRDKREEKNAKFAMAFHCCQPVFNFGWEIERAYKNAYLPLLETLAEFPEIRASFHYSGNMVEWFERYHPGYIEKVRMLIRRRQIELIGGGCFDPIMALIPERDRKEQLEMNEKLLKRVFGVTPVGAWIAERVWEPCLADTLSDAGVKYTIVDDHHILRAGKEEEQIFRPCLTRGERGSVVLFPSLRRLRYSMPFLSPDVTLEYLKKTAAEKPGESVCFFYADDGEKFGAWPYTYRLVHKKGWLRDFFLLLRENSDWLQTTTYSEVMDTVAPLEVKEVPESSYAEMMEWSGGSFKNFLVKYPEADRMHKRMISLSDTIHRLGDQKENADAVDEERVREARRELFKAQTGCAYWHGTFGGLYLPHLRAGVYEHLIKAQNIIDRARDKDEKKVRITEQDLGDERSETVIGNELVDIFVRSSGGGCVSELDHKGRNVNLANTMSRQKEDYHRKLERDHSSRVKQARKAIRRGAFPDIHDILGRGERGLKKILFYDDYRRASFLTHVFRHRRPWKGMHKGHVSHKSFLSGAYVSRSETGKDSVTHRLSRRDKVFIDNGRPFDLEVVKEITLDSGPAIDFSHKVLKHSGGPLSLKCAVEFNFMICDKTVLSGPRLKRTDRISLKDQYSSYCLDLFLDGEFDVFTYPVYTVNETDSGLKKQFQGVSVMIGDEYDSAGEGVICDTKITLAVG